MARTKISSHIDFSGPFFTHDPSETFLANVEKMMAAVAAEGEADVVQQLRAGEGKRQPLSIGGRVADNIHGRVRGRTGWHRWAAISPYEPAHSKAEATAIYAAASKVETQTHAFRHTSTAIRKAKAVNVEELLKGIA